MIADTDDDEAATMKSWKRLDIETAKLLEIANRVLHKVAGQEWSKFCKFIEQSARLQLSPFDALEGKRSFEKLLARGGRTETGFRTEVAL